jgi:hypothetical protein
MIRPLEDMALQHLIDSASQKTEQIPPHGLPVKS